MSPPEEFEAPNLRSLLIASGIAVLVASIVLVGAVLPAEYGIDPTGFGHLTGISDLYQSDSSLENVTEEFRVLDQYAATWPVASKEVFITDGTATDENLEITIPVTTANLITLQATITWTDDEEFAGGPTAPDRFHAALTPPGRTAGPEVAASNVEGGDGTLTLTWDWQDVPEPVTIEAESLDDASFQAQDLHPPDHSGSGDWTLAIRAEPGQGQVQGMDVSGTDSGDDFQLAVAGEFFALTDDLQASGVRITEHVFGLGKGGSHEFKMYLDEGWVVDYEWNVSAGDAYYDFHGDPSVGGSFVRHSEGDTASKTETFTAPFEGNHGWYWLNKLDDQEVFVTLRLTGEYVLL